MRSIAALTLVMFLFTGCYTIKYIAPAGKDVSTLSEQKATSYKKETKIWYALWGLVPITDNTTEALIAQNNLKEVRVTSKVTALDFVIGIFTGFASIVPHTVILEGNP